MALVPEIAIQGGMVVFMSKWKRDARPFHEAAPDSKALNDREGAEGAAEEGSAFGAEPALEDGGVNLSEISFVDDVSVHQVSEVGGVTVNAGLDLVSKEEDGRGGAMIGAGAAIFLDAAAKFAEGEDQDSLAFCWSRRSLRKAPTALATSARTRAWVPG